MKVNLGASPIWEKGGWHTLDHKLEKSSGPLIAGDAENMDIPSSSCDVVFCSHMFEHIPHVKLPRVIAEINRILRPGGILRILTPDLEKITKAYVSKDSAFFDQARNEDETIRTDLGLGGMLMNFIVSPGQDTVLIDRGLQNFIAGYAHLYCYDYDMLATMLNAIGFNPRKAEFNDSTLPELREPLHVVGLPPVWECLNQEFYSKNNLIHKMVDGVYHINFKVTGFDRDPITSLIIEATKSSNVDVVLANKYFNKSERNYNRYSTSLLTDSAFRERLTRSKIKYEVDVV